MSNIPLPSSAVVPAWNQEHQDVDALAGLKVAHLVEDWSAKAMMMGVKRDARIGDD